VIQASRDAIGENERFLEPREKPVGRLALTMALGMARARF